MSFACFTWRTDEPGRSDALSRLLPGLALGLALLTKATAYLYAAPFLILVVVRQAGRRRLAVATWVSQVPSTYRESGSQAVTEFQIVVPDATTAPDT
jgi:hypothetical protein